MGFHSGMPLPAWPTPFGPFWSGCPCGDGSEQDYQAVDLKKRVHQWMAAMVFRILPHDRYRNDKADGRSK